MTSRLDGFTPDSFEQFIRMLAIKLIGPGVMAFGNGPDGGREATFDGKVPFPFPPTDEWNGYGVIQAKFKEKRESTQIDQAWGLKCLRTELDAFVEKRKSSRKPEYYVFATNVELTSAERGGINLANELIGEYVGRLPIKGWAIWSYSQLVAYIDSHESIRVRFAAFLTPSDLISELLVNLRQRKSDVARILTSYLDRELRSDKLARLEQAGDRADTSLALARVFVDLPSSDARDEAAPQEKEDSEGRLPSGTLAELVAAGSRKLDPLTLREHEWATMQMRGERIFQAVVLFGGPGSGKSTVGQYFAQIHRAALLDRLEPHHLTSDTNSIIRDLKERSAKERIPWPPTPRYPIRIELNRFAKSLAENKTTSLSEFILKELRGNYQFSHEEFLITLKQLPWLLVLDGLAVR